jgi:queuine/archaeosine tRNA-ribosyltransferase
MLALHNIVFYHNLMDKIRQNIENGTFNTWAEQAINSPAYSRNNKIDNSKDNGKE